MRKAVIHYFTGTGNTAHATDVLAGELNKNGYETLLIEVHKDTKPVDIQFDLNIIIFPVYALAAPHVMIGYLKKLPKGKGAKTAVIANFGMINLKGGANTGYESQAPEQAARILRRRGYDVFLTGRAGYPENITIIASSISREDIDSITIAGDKEIRAIAGKIINGEISIVRYNVLDLTLGWLFGFLLMHFGRWQIGKMYSADRDCNSCGICVQSCPAEAIRLFNKKPRWNYNCEACLRCYNICPKTAIQISIIRIAVVLALTIGLIPLVVVNINSALNLIASYLKIRPVDIPFLKVITGIAAYILIYIIIFYILDKIMFILEQIPFVRKIFKWTYTKKFKRYVMPGFNNRATSTGSVQAS